jgi:hypothetical protein
LNNYKFHRKDAEGAESNYFLFVADPPKKTGGQEGRQIKRKVLSAFLAALR